MSKMSNIIAAQKHEWPTRLATRKVQYKTQIETNKIHFYYIILFYFIKSFVTYAVKDSFFVDVKTFLFLQWYYRWFTAISLSPIR